MRTKAVTKRMLEMHLSVCMNNAIWACAKDPTLIFSGCPEATQLAARVVDRLGHAFMVFQGKAITWDKNVVDHIWVELPELELRIETNASQILGIPTFVQVLDVAFHPERYRDAFENMAFLERVTEKGEEFYGAMADKIARCVRTRARR